MPWIAWRYRAVPETATPDQHLRRLISLFPILPGGQIAPPHDHHLADGLPARHLVHRLQARRGEWRQPHTRRRRAPARCQPADGTAPDSHLRRLISTMPILPGGQIMPHTTTISPTEPPARHLAHRLQKRGAVSGADCIPVAGGRLLDASLQGLGQARQGKPSHCRRRAPARC